MSRELPPTDSYGRFLSHVISHHMATNPNGTVGSRAVAVFDEVKLLGKLVCP